MNRVTADPRLTEPAHRGLRLGTESEQPVTSAGSSLGLEGVGRRTELLFWLPLADIRRSVLEHLAQFQLVDAFEKTLEAREFGRHETVRIDGNEHDRTPRHHIFVHVLDEEEVFVESNAVHDALDAVQEDDAAFRMVVDERLDDFREEADRGRGVVPISRAVRDPPDWNRGEAVPRAHLFRVDSRDAEPGSSPFDEVLKEPIARLGLFALDEVAGPRLQLDGSF